MASSPPVFGKRAPVVIARDAPPAGHPWRRLQPVAGPGWLFRGSVAAVSGAIAAFALSPGEVASAHDAALVVAEPGRPLRAARYVTPVKPQPRLPTEASPGSTAPVVDTTPLTLTGNSRDGIYAAATAAGAPPLEVQTYLRAIASKAQFGGIGFGEDGRYEIVIARERLADGTVRYGRLLYAALIADDRAIRMIEWRVGGQLQWLDDGEAGSSGDQAVGAPVAGARLTSRYGMRFHPVLGYQRLHAGTDFAAAPGTPVRAVTGGAVALAGWHGGHGLMVKLRHGGGVGTGYAHLSGITVSPGEAVVQGQVIGYVGSTGLSTGPHLHFEVYRDGRAVDPAGLRFASASVLPPAQLAAFRARMAALRPQATPRVMVAAR